MELLMGLETHQLIIIIILPLLFDVSAETLFRGFPWLSYDVHGCPKDVHSSPLLL